MPHHPVACPVCGNTMVKHAIPQGIDIDLCEAHGVWLDRGELEALVQAPAPPAGRSGRKRAAGEVAAPALAAGAASTAPSSGFGAAVERAGQQFGRSMVHGAGSTLGRRLMNGVVDAVFGKR